MKMLNEEAKAIWMNDRMAKGYSFVYEKAHIPGETYSDGTPEKERNVAVTCVETGERFKFLWT
jgi:hypothetical protein